MEEMKTTGPWGTALKWGIIVGLINAVISYVASMNVDFSSFESLEASRRSPTQYITYATMLAAVVLAQLEHRKKDLGGIMGYGRAVGVATIVGMAMGVLTAIYMYVFAGILHPEMQQVMMEGALQQAGDITPEQEEQMMSMMSFWTSPAFLAIMGFIGSTFMALVGGLIAGIFTHKNQQ